MPNRFNQIFEREQYVPMVQPLPYEALAGLGESFQKENDQLTDANFKLQELMKKIQVDPYDTPYKKQFDDEYYKILSPISEKIAKGDPSARRDLMEAQSKFNMDQRLNTFAHNYQMGKTAREDYQKLQNEGKTSRYGWSNTFDEAARARKQLEPFNYQGHNPWFDPYKDAENIVGGINDTQLRSGMKYFDVGPNGKLILKGNSGITGISEGKLRQVAQASFESFINSNGGRSYIRDLQQQGITDEKELRQKTYQYLVDVGTKQLGQKGGDPILDSVGDHYNEDPKGSSIGILDASPFSGSYKAKFNPAVNDSKIFSGSTSGYTPYGTVKSSDLTKASTESYKFTPQDERILQIASKVYGKGIPNDKSERIKMINDYNERFFNRINYNRINMSNNPKEIEKENKLLFDNRQISLGPSLIDVDDPSNKIKGSDFLSKYGEQEEKSFIGTVPHDNPWGVPGGKLISVNTKNGEKKFIIPNSPELGTASYGDVAINKLYQETKYQPSATSEIEGVNATYEFQFIPNSLDYLDNSGNALYTAGGEMKIYKKDKDGKRTELETIVNDGTLEAAGRDLITESYNYIFDPENSLTRQFKKSNKK